MCATIEDVRRVLASPRQSFEDLLQCLHVAQSQEQWDLVDYGPAEDLKREIEGIRKREATRIGGR